MIWGENPLFSETPKSLKHDYWQPAVFNFRRYRMEPVWWSEALKRDPRVDGHADAWLRYVASNALLNSLLDWMGYFSVVILKAYCFLYQLMLPKLNGNGRSIILFSNLVVATSMKSYELHTPPMFDGIRPFPKAVLCSWGHDWFHWRRSRQNSCSPSTGTWPCGVWHQPAAEHFQDTPEGLGESM